MTLPKDRVLLGIILLAAGLGLAYNFAMLLGFGPDEPRHMAYVKLLFSAHEFPRMNPDGSEYQGAHSYHPPLYYLVLLPFYAVFRTLPGNMPWHAMRLISLLLCLISLPLIYQIALRAGEGDKWLARLAVAQVALLPIFGMTCGIINNDSALLLAVTVFLWLLAVKYPADLSWKSAFVLGLWLGLGGLCKGTAFFCDGTALLVYFGLQNGGRGLWAVRPWLRLGVSLLTAGIIAGPWYARNLHLYGAWQPIPRGFAPADMGWLPRAEYGPLIQMMHPNFPPLVGRAVWGIFYSLWSQKDWIPEALRLGIYLAFAAYCLAALAGAVRRKWGRVAATGPSIAVESRRGAQIAFWCPAAACAAAAAACLEIALFVHWGQAEGGRYLLPGLSGLSIALARGWRGLIGPRRLPALTLGWCVAMLSLNVLTLYWLLHYLNPTFGPKT